MNRVKSSNGVVIQNVSVVNPDESKIISINALTEYDSKPIENTSPTNPAVVYNPYLEEVFDLKITILKTKDNSIPSMVKLGIFGCGEAVNIATKAQIESATTGSSGTLLSSILPEITTTSTSMPDTNGTIVTAPQQITTATSSSNGFITTLTVTASSGTTMKTCEETQVVNESVSKKITVTPNGLPNGVNIEFQLASTSGVSFPNDQKTPQINVHLNEPQRIQSIAIPRDKTVNGNVEQFEVTFYSPDEKKINDNPILSNPSSKENKSKPAELDSTQIPRDRPVLRIEITIVKTTDSTSPKGVVLDIKACTEAITETTTITPLSTISSVTVKPGETGVTPVTTGITGTESKQPQETSSTTQPVSGTTPKECEEMQAIDENVSKKITTSSNTLPR
ncbi:unnamed protein product, partial [Rotaria sordida]